MRKFLTGELLTFDSEVGNGLRQATYGIGESRQNIESPFVRFQSHDSHPVRALLDQVLHNLVMAMLVRDH